MDSTLPPFGIRELREGEPFSVLQITEQQYQSTVKSYPVARLTYIDEDDGEDVTVGTGLEFRQRLEEQPLPTAPLVYCYNTHKNQFEERMIHLFDVTRTNSSRSLWKEHALNYRVFQRRHEKAATNNEHASVSSVDLNTTDQIAQEIASIPKKAGSKVDGIAFTTTESQLATALSEAIPDLVENLASLLDSTSESLRKAAQKSRQSNTSPIEDVLTGFGNIVTEIGGFGLSLLDSLTEKSISDTSPKVETIKSDSQPSSVRNVTFDDQVKTIDEESTTTLKDSVSSHSSKSDGYPDEYYYPLVGDLRCNSCKTLRLLCFRHPSVKDACRNCVGLGETCSWSTIPTLAAVEAPASNVFPPGNQTTHDKSHSILDQDTDDADFSRRYPPLLSLRRANTIAGIHDRYSKSEKDNLEGKDGSNGTHLRRHHSWVRRYPHRPTPPVLDAETQRRKEFAQDCYPAQRYTPGPGTQNLKLPPLRKHSMPQMRLANTETMASNRSDQSNPFHQNNDVTTTIQPKVDLESPVSVQPPLPGAWPEIKYEGNSTMGASAGESSGAFFNRMMRDNPARRQQHLADSNARLTRHRSFSKQSSNNNPFSELNRSRTVSSTTNPASRLNRPFEPLYPVVGPVHTTDIREAEIEDRRKADNTSRYGTSQAPSSLHERVSAPRPFSPVWEEHIQKVQTEVKEKSDEIKRRVKEQMSQVKKFDRNGESSSMYSPPPRHMRSVPNFTTFTSSVPIKTTSTSDANNSTPAPKRNSLPLDVSSLKPTKMTPQTIQIPPSPSRFVPFTVFNDAPQYNPTPIVRTPPRSKRSKKSTSDEALRKCVTTLRDMGYGLGDENLNSRLHVYAAASDGDVMEAIDMIEEDKKAHLG